MNKYDEIKSKIEKCLTDAMKERATDCWIVCCDTEDGGIWSSNADKDVIKRGGGKYAIRRFSDLMEPSQRLAGSSVLTQWALDEKAVNDLAEDLLQVWGYGDMDENDRDEQERLAWEEKKEKMDAEANAKMKYKVGDIVRIKSDLNPAGEVGIWGYGGGWVNEEMVEMCGKTTKITKVKGMQGGYYVEGSKFCWTDELFEDELL